MAALLKATNSLDPSPDEVAAFYKARISACGMAARKERSPEAREGHEEAAHRWRELLAIHLQCEAEERARG